MAETVKVIGQQLFESQLREGAKICNDFFGEETMSERAVQDAEKVVGELINKGWTNIVAIVAPNRDFSQNASYAGWKTRPNNWFYDQVRAGRIPGESTRIGGGIAIFDTTPKPDYTDGTQMYDDPESYQALLSDLRRNGAIGITGWTRHIPETSRLGISADEYENVVFPALVEQIGVEGMVAERRLSIRLPKTIELNVYGNQFARYIGDTTGWEWNHDRFGRVFRLIGGVSDHGGLSHVSYAWSVRHRDGFAGRFLGEIPSQTR